MTKERSKSKLSRERHTPLIPEDTITIPTVSKMKQENLNESFENFPYVQKTIDKMSRNLAKDFPNKKKKFDFKSFHSSLTNQSMKNYDSLLQSTLTPMQNTVNHSLTEDARDMFMVKYHHKILHIESTVEKMIERYRFKKNALDAIEKQVSERYQKKILYVTEKNHKPPAFLDDIKQGNSDAIDILARKTNAPLRFKKRINHGFKKKYQKYWQNLNEHKKESSLTSNT